MGNQPWGINLKPKTTPGDSHSRKDPILLWIEQNFQTTLLRTEYRDCYTAAIASNPTSSENLVTEIQTRPSNSVCPLLDITNAGVPNLQDDFDAQPRETLDQSMFKMLFSFVAMK